MKRFLFVALAVLVLMVFAAVFAASRFNVSALPEPGDLETKLATRAKHFLIERRSRRDIPAPPADRQASATSGDVLYGTECSSCHGLDGRHPTDPGRWMYPRAADLTSPEVQQYSDGALFWIIRNGIRLSGMPAFGNVETDEHIWNLVDDLRTLASRPTKADLR
jgi:mono/diheme cytochrome c family protein